MQDDQLLRYSRQIMLPGVGLDGQERLAAAHAVIFGLGGLGCPVALYLAAAGVGQLTLIDDDVVDHSNLQRQILHREQDVGRLKVDSAAEVLLERTPFCRIQRMAKRPGLSELKRILATVDVVIDGTDSFASRNMINLAAVNMGIPLVSGAVIRFEGQLTTFHSLIPESPCYHCLYGDGEEVGDTCTENGVLASLPGMMGTLQATEALKVLLGLPTLVGRLLVVDGLQMQFREFRLPRDPDCPVCGAGSSIAPG